MSIINKLTLKKGAIFDYEEIVCFMPCPIAEIRTFLEKELTAIKDENPRIRYTCPQTGKELLLFVKKGYKFGIMQTWILEGICEAKDYSEEMETNGTIKEWLEVDLDEVRL